MLGVGNILTLCLSTPLVFAAAAAATVVTISPISIATQSSSSILPSTPNENVTDAVNTTTPLPTLTDDDDPTEPECWGPSGFGTQPNLDDCWAAARMYRADHFYDDNITYTTYPTHITRGSADCLAPLIFHRDSCAIYVGAQPLTGDYKFSLKDKWPIISRLMLQCLVTRKPEHRYGGMVRLGRDRVGKDWLACVGTRPCDPSVAGSGTVAS